ncbi:valine--tRNA ligase [Candidatus Neomarinimicrobiota bacterium]
MARVELGKVYLPAEAESKWYHTWETKGYFKPAENPTAESYTIVIPPPNVTGILHMGHVLNNTIQDILIRRARMQGYNTLWLPGTDHASIATEAKVVHKLKEGGTDKQTIGREKFLQEAWNWSDKYGGTIIEQLKRLGASCDWSRQAFTMDEDYYAAVIKTFVQLYDEGYIYRGTRLINWDPVGQTALSDEEVIHQKTNGHLWYFRYPLKDDSGYVVVATTRPETMFGDTAIAVNPDDERYKSLIGKTAVLPLVGRELKIFADEFVDPEFGTGAVKVTPAHDHNDYQMGQNHNLEMVNVLTPAAALNENVPERFVGMDRFEGRKAVVAAMEEAGLLDHIEDHVNNIGHSERTRAMVEPYLSRQWFCRMPELAKPAIKAVESGGINFFPGRWTKVYDHWMSNILDWCISRQLWWGHRIPAWYGPDGQVFVAQTEPEAIANASKHYGNQDVELEQDPDVLDTWFSSWLWPFATLGWPGNQNPDLKQFYPTQTLVTAPDIIFFWVARMVMAGLHFRGESPFSTVYFTGMVRDNLGRKMSKSLGNSPDPIELIDEYGADALRTGLMLIAPQGQDIPFSEDDIAQGRNYMNKIWNAARFVLMNLDDELPPSLDTIADDRLEEVDHWMLARLARCLDRVEQAYERYRINEVAKLTYEMVWADYCDWYVEFIKSRLQGDDAESRVVAQSVAVYVMRNILKLLHPFAPFISEKLWQQFKGADEPDIIMAAYPLADHHWDHEPSTAAVNLLKEVVTAVRSTRSGMGIGPGKRSALHIRGSVTDTQIISTMSQYLKRLCWVDKLVVAEKLEKPQNSASAVAGELEIFMPLAGLIDLAVERERLAKNISELAGRIAAGENKLGNENFVKRAPADVVAHEEQKQAANKEQLAKLRSSLDAIS